MRQTIVRTLTAGLILIFIPVPSAAAQSQAAAATLEGYVYDPTGAVVADVTVTIVNAATGLTRTVKTNALGYYVAPLLPPGTYRVTFAKPGFAELKLEDVELRVGDTLTVNGTLQPAGIREEILITAETLPVVETSRTQPGTVIERSVIDVLPLNGRNWTELVLLTPGVTAADDFGNVSFRRRGSRLQQYSGRRSRQQQRLLRRNSRADARTVSVQSGDGSRVSRGQ